MRYKPRKPFPSFPLTAHNNGQWIKKIDGRTFYFGPWADPDGAFKSYLSQANDLHFGPHQLRGPHRIGLAESSPRRDRTAKSPTLQTVADAFLDGLEGQVQSRELSVAVLRVYPGAIRGFLRVLGPERRALELSAADFLEHRSALMAKNHPTTVMLYVAAVKTMFRYAKDVGVLVSLPDWGSRYKAPSATLRRKARHRRVAEFGEPFFAPAEVRQLIDAAEKPPWLRICILLAVNGGFGQQDCSDLELGHVDFGAAIIDFPRPKTAVSRVVPIWPVTATALREWLQIRPPAHESGELDRRIFLTGAGQPLRAGRDRLGETFIRLASRLHLERPGRGFYGLRRTFRTIADEANDQHATARIMGHTLPSMSDVYVRAISQERLRAVTDHVHAKVFDG